MATRRVCKLRKLGPAQEKEKRRRGGTAACSSHSACLKQRHLPYLISLDPLSTASVARWPPLKPLTSASTGMVFSAARLRAPQQLHESACSTAARPTRLPLYRVHRCSAPLQRHSSSSPRGPLVSPAAVPANPAAQSKPRPSQTYTTHKWMWNGHKINYCVSGADSEMAPQLLLPARALPQPKQHGQRLQLTAAAGACLPMGLAGCSPPPPHPF